MQEESRRRILEVRVEALRHRDEPSAVLFQRLDVVQAVHQRSPEPIELPHENAIKLPCPCVFHHPIQLWPARSRAAHNVLVRFPDLPPLVCGELAEFANLKLTILVRCRNSDVGSYSHDRTPCRRFAGRKSLPHSARDNIAATEKFVARVPAVYLESAEGTI